MKRRLTRLAALGAGTDEGSALVIVLAFILIGALFVTPMMQYAVVGHPQPDPASRTRSTAPRP